MNLKSINESFKKLHEDDEPIVIDEMSNKEALKHELYQAYDNLKQQFNYNIKSYEVAFQEVIEKLFPENAWWEVTDCDIFGHLFTERDPEATIEEIIKSLKPEYSSETTSDIKEVEEDLQNDSFTTKVEYSLTDDNFDNFISDLKNRDEEKYNITIDGKKIDNDFADITIKGSKENIDKYKKDFQFDLMEESLIESLTRIISKLNEDQISDEDKRDSDHIRSMLDKLKKRSNARFTPEEQAVLDKYNIKRDNNLRNLEVDKTPLDQRIDKMNPNWDRSARYNNGNKDKINYADRARKMKDRNKNQIFKPSWFTKRNADINAHTSGKYKDTLTDMHNYSQDIETRDKIRAMKDALRDRKWHKDYIDGAEDKYNKDVEKAKAEYERAIRAAEREKEDSTTGYHKKSFDRAQGEIDTLLKRNKAVEEDYTPYDPQNGWTEDDIKLHKSIDWKARNYENYPVPEDNFNGKAIAYGLPGGTKEQETKFIKYVRANPIFPPYYGAESKPFEGTVGGMYDGRNHKTYQVHDRYETQEVYDRLSESKSINEETSPFESEFYNDYIILKNRAGDGWDVYSYEGTPERVKKVFIEEEGLPTLKSAKEFIDELNSQVNESIEDKYFTVSYDSNGVNSVCMVKAKDEKSANDVYMELKGKDYPKINGIKEINNGQADSYKKRGMSCLNESVSADTVLRVLLKEYDEQCDTQDDFETDLNNFADTVAIYNADCMKYFEMDIRNMFELGMIHCENNDSYTRHFDVFVRGALNEIIFGFSGKFKQMYDKHKSE